MMLPFPYLGTDPTPSQIAEGLKLLARGLESGEIKPTDVEYEFGRSTGGLPYARVGLRVEVSEEFSLTISRDVA